jgi:hypothetical protein
MDLTDAVAAGIPSIASHEPERAAEPLPGP